MNHQSDGKKAAIEEEKLGIFKEDEMEFEMEVDASVPQAESAEVKKARKRR